jgi:prepilin-type N-terminal cleavage/methylation domain-containing protein
MYRQLSAPTSRPARPTGGLRGGFTLVELLVVIVIIAMLVGLLVPAVQMAREAARKSQCMNNQRNLGIAIINYATNKERFPPLFTIQPNSLNPMMPNGVGWVPQILPNIEQNEFYRAFQNNQWNTIPTAQIETLLCPSRNPGSSPAPSSYVVNAGAQDAVKHREPMDYQENGVFFDEFSSKYFMPANFRTKPTPPIDLAYLSSHDGTKNTIMLSENLDARDWITLASSPSHNSPTSLTPTPYPGLADNGKSDWCAITWEQPKAGYPEKWGMELAPTGSRLNKAVTSSTPKDYERGRPYSNHSGGFFVTFCDASTRFVSEDVQYRVYCLLMAPDSNNAKYTFLNNPHSPDGSPVKYPKDWWQNLIVGGSLVNISDVDIP